MRIYLVSIITIFLTFTSCVTILQSLITPDNITTDKRIDGVWIDSDSKNILVQRLMNSKFKNIFAEARSDHKELSLKDSVFYTKHYIISYRENNLEYTWTGGIVKIRDQYYLNLQPEECLNSNGKEAYNLQKVITASTIAKLKWTNNNSLAIYFLNGDYIKKIVLAGKAQIRHEYDPLFGTFVITASSKELEQFLEKYGNNEDLFKGGNTIILTRKS